jgi:hypothetical protein
MAATIFQRNRRAYLEEEAKLHDVLADKTFQTHFQSWLDGTIAQLDMQFEACEQQLGELQQNVAVDEGNYWNSKTIMQHCNLHIDAKRLIRKGVEVSEHPSWAELIRLVSVLHQLKSKGFITPTQTRFIENCESELKNVVFEPREITFIVNALETKLKDDGNSRSVFSDLTKYQNAIDEVAADLDQCEQLLEAALMNGDVALAEDISYRQLEMYEHVLKLVTDQYPIINQFYAEATLNERRRRWAIFRMANKDIGSVIEAKRRQVEACEEDQIKIKEQLQNYTADDGFQRKRYEIDRSESDAFLQQNKEKQQGVWNRIYGMLQELQTCQEQLEGLAEQRQREIDRRLRMEEREASRRSGHEAFIRAAAAHAQKLQDTIDNSLRAKDIAKALNDFVLDGCDSVTSKYDKQQKTLNEMLRLVQQHHFKRFSDYYVACSRLLYRKNAALVQINNAIDDNVVKRELMSETFDPTAKKYADENRVLESKKRGLAEEIVSLRHRLGVSENSIKLTLQAFQLNGIKYVHPKDIVEKVNFDRTFKMLDFRAMVDPGVSKNDRERIEETQSLELLRAQIAAQKDAALKAPIKPSQTLMNTPYQRFAAILDRPLDMPSTSTAAAPAASASGSAHSGGGGGDVAPQEQQTSSAFAAPAGSMQLEGCSLRALYRYKARAADELTFEKGDIIVCIAAAAEEGWYKGVCNQRAGLFPVNYVTRTDTTE